MRRLQKQKHQLSHNVSKRIRNSRSFTPQTSALCRLIMYVYNSNEKKILFSDVFTSSKWSANKSKGPSIGDTYKFVNTLFSILILWIVVVLMYALGVFAWLFESVKWDECRLHVLLVSMYQACVYNKERFYSYIRGRMSKYVVRPATKSSKDGGESTTTELDSEELTFLNLGTTPHQMGDIVSGPKIPKPQNSPLEVKWGGNLTQAYLIRNLYRSVDMLKNFENSPLKWSPESMPFTVERGTSGVIFALNWQVKLPHHSTLDHHGITDIHRLDTFFTGTCLDQTREWAIQNSSISNSRVAADKKSPDSFIYLDEAQSNLNINSWLLLAKENRWYEVNTMQAHDNFKLATTKAQLVRLIGSPEVKYDSLLSRGWWNPITGTRHGFNTVSNLVKSPVDELDMRASTNGNANPGFQILSTEGGAFVFTTTRDALLKPTELTYSTFMEIHNAKSLGTTIASTSLSSSNAQRSRDLILIRANNFSSADAPNLETFHKSFYSITHSKDINALQTPNKAGYNSSSSTDNKK